MPKFAYLATDLAGAPVSGVQKADSRADAELALYERELRGIKVTEKKSFLQSEISPRRVKRAEIMHFSRQLGAFISAGIPILDAVHTLGEEASNPSAKKMLADVEEGLRSGDRLSDCLDRHPRIFPDYYRGILRSAELTGRLDTVLDQLGTYLERDLDARRKVTSAMVYPAIIAGMSVVTVVVLATFVLPRFKTFFKSLNAKLPLPTRMLLAVTDFLTQWWWALAIGAATVALVLLLSQQAEAGKHLRDRLVLATPVLGDTVRFALVERFCRILASMTNAGVGLPEALRVASGTVRNLVYTRALAKVGEALLEGAGLATPLVATNLFPTTAAQMMRVGEETGTLDTQLDVAARYYERELDYKIKRLTALFEPAVIIVMGLIVGFVAIALISAMYGIYHQVKV